MTATTPSDIPVPARARRQRWLEFKKPISQRSTILLGIAVWVIFFGLWELAVAMGWVNATFMPPPQQVLTGLYELIVKENFALDIGVSIYRIIISFALACAVALASLHVFTEERTLERLGGTIARLRERLATDVAPLLHVGEVRQQGIMVGIELVAERGSRAPHEPAARIGQRVVLAARRRGVVVRPLGNVIVLMPPLAISLPEVDLLVDVARDAIVEVTGS